MSYEIDGERKCITDIKLRYLSEKPADNIVVEKDDRVVFTYSVEFEPISGITGHRIETNVSGNDIPDGYKDKDDFSLPDGPTVFVYLDDRAIITDMVSCPSGFTCDILYDGSKTFTGNATASYAVNVTNVDVECGNSVDLINAVDLTVIPCRTAPRAPPAASRRASARVRGARMASVTGRTIPGNQDDCITDLLPVMLGAWEVTDGVTADNILQQTVYGEPSTGITKIYAHLLATQLNIANGSDLSAIADTVEVADAFLESRSQRLGRPGPTAEECRKCLEGHSRALQRRRDRAGSLHWR